MRPRRTPDSNKVFSLEGGTEDNDLWVEVRADVSRGPTRGVPIICSTWELTPEEREAVAGGANIELRIWGMQPPVQLVTTETPLGRTGEVAHLGSPDEVATEVCPGCEQLIGPVSAGMPIAEHNGEVWREACLEEAERDG